MEGSSLILFLLFVKFATPSVDLYCVTEEQCLNKPVQYQCTVTDSIVLNWRIRDENMTSLGTESYTPVNDLVISPAPFPNSLPFLTDYTSKSPSLISNIVFTVQSSINGYTIHCEDGDGNMENCTIEGLPPPPHSITVSYIDTVAIIAWQPPSVTVPYSQCVSCYTIDSTIIVTSTTVDTSVSVSLAGLFPGVYTVKVASIDYANRTGSYCNVLSFELKVPPAPGIVIQSDTHDSTITLILIFNNSGIPPVLTSYINIVPDPIDITLVDITQEDFITAFNYSVTIQRGTLYNVTGFGGNVIGNGSTANIPIIDKILPSVTAYVTSITSSSLLPSSNTNSSTAVTIGVALAVLIVLLMVVIIIIIAIMIFYGIKRFKRGNDEHDEINGAELTGIAPHSTMSQSDVVNEENEVDTRMDDIPIWKKPFVNDQNPKELFVFGGTSKPSSQPAEEKTEQKEDKEIEDVTHTPNIDDGSESNCSVDMINVNTEQAEDDQCGREEENDKYINKEANHVPTWTKSFIHDSYKPEAVDADEPIGLFKNNYAQLDISAGTTPRDNPIQVTVDYSKIKFQVEYTTVTIVNTAGDDVKHPQSVPTVNYSVVTYN